MSKSHVVLVLVAGGVLLSVGCGGPDRGAVGERSSSLISDELHNGGTRGFLFLPPMVPPPGNYGDFIPGLPVTVRIDEIRVDGTTLRTLASFTAISGPRREHLRLHFQNARCDPDDDDGDLDPVGFYLARWKTDDEHLSVSATYRVRVLVPAHGGGARELGFADVKVVRNEREFRTVDTREFTPLVNGRVLRIKFRIDAPAVDADGDDVFDWLDNCPRTANRNQKDSLRNGIGDACRCDAVRCTAQDDCHARGVCDGRTGVCSNPPLADGTLCTIPNATASCLGGSCRRTACNPGYGDCNADARDGCETPLDTVGNCGACAAACPGGVNASAVCSAGACGLSCATGWADCDGRLATGCERAVAADPINCGGCGVVCANHEACAAGACTSASCQPGFANCNGVAGDGCEVVLATDVSNCGQCGRACAYANGSAACTAGACVLVGCTGSWADCDHDPADGCERDLVGDVANCGACGSACALGHATASCAGGACLVASCASGFADCDGVATNGCEIDLTADVTHCGSCGNGCVVPHATPACEHRTCVVSACQADWEDCDGEAGNGCEIHLATDPANCGVCGRACPSGDHATARCTGGGCAIDCQPGWADCDGTPGNGCEVDVQTDPANCGTCGGACNHHETCQSGGCSVAECAAGFANCDGEVGNGCEAALAVDPANCGTCGAVCAIPNTFATCDEGHCGFSVCQQGWADCDGDAVDGCEVHLVDNSLHCGGCGAACALPHATAGCTAAQCSVIACDAGWADCDGEAANGCEVPVASDIANCGACGARCAIAQGVAACTSGVCAVASCSAGWLDCDGLAETGCEIAAADDVLNCGACGSVCTVAHGAPACLSGACRVGACEAGFADCDGLFANGCETALSTDPGHCGACGLACSAPHGTAACVAGVCAVARCDAGRADCNGLASDGCEVDVASDAGNCGGCGHACAFDHGVASCRAGACGLDVCQPGFANCDGLPGNGCEAALLADAGNCGACGVACTVVHGTGECEGGACRVGACQPGFADCDGLLPNGCEAALGSDPYHCGACGAACTYANGTGACAGGSCQLVGCNAGWADCDHEPTTGCEVSIASDVRHCGSCDKACSQSHATETCTQGACQIVACDSGWSHCSGSVDSGCETATASDPANCGVCGHACPAIHASPSCSAGACAFACTAPYRDCDGSPANGCEVDTGSDPAHCGACGRVCPSSNAPGACSGGACTFGCAAGEADLGHGRCESSVACAGGAGGGNGPAIAACGGAVGFAEAVANASRVCASGYHMCTAADLQVVGGSEPNVQPAGIAWVNYTDPYTTYFKGYFNNTACSDGLGGTNWSNLRGTSGCNNSGDYPEGWRLAVSAGGWSVNSHQASVGCVPHVLHACGYPGGVLAMRSAYTLCCRN